MWNLVSLLIDYISQHEDAFSLVFGLLLLFSLGHLIIDSSKGSNI